MKNNFDRRTFLAGLVGSGALVGSPILKGSERAFDDPSFVDPSFIIAQNAQYWHDLKLMVGIQNPANRPKADIVPWNDKHAECKAFFLTSSRAEKTSEEIEATFASGLPREVCLTMVSAYVPLFERHDLETWRVLAAKQLLSIAQVHPLTSSRLRPIGDPIDGDSSYTEFNEHMARFVMRRRRNWIAKCTRRGVANTLIANESGMKMLNNVKATLVDTSHGKQQFSPDKIVVFKDKEIISEPFALIGYHGKGQQSLTYDCAVALVVAPDFTKNPDYGGFAYHPMASKYWTRIV